MTELIKGKATICVANYKTLDFTRLCLRSIRKFTSYPYEAIVVDNNSQDQSLEYLKNLNWISLIERPPEPDEPGGGYAHAAALDLGLANCNTEFFVSMHSDTIIQKTGWLTELISYFDNNENIACVGSGKIELTPKWRVFLKKTTDFRTFKRKLFREPDPIGKYRYYNRTICCLYRTDILRHENLSFLMDRDKGLTGGKKLYFELVDRDYKTVELPPPIMGNYIVHLAHATQVANPEEFTLRRKTVRKCHRLVNKVLSRASVQSILTDDSLDL
ncbi:MAG: glycosyltransferase family 2 protein [Planctomycetota bacterium]|jgi:glycosyltransferase involved in cell wall biosynthesis